MTITDIDDVDLGIQYTSDELDEKRQNRSAYDYLCRLHEVRNWLAACLGEENIPLPIELEENLRNGVLLARLANYFAPECVPIERIFDINQERYKTSGPVYRHTDNVMNWRRAMIHIRFPEIIIPETVDIYEGRNIRTIFCLYALAIHLFRLRKAPAIHNEAGNLSFSEEDMEKIKERLQNEGVTVSFGDVGTLLSKGKKVDANADILEMISESVTQNDVETFLLHLSSPEAGFLFVNSKLAEKYLAELRLIGSNPLTARVIQTTIQKVNEQDALERLESYLIRHGDDPKFNNLSHILVELYSEKVYTVALPFYNDILRERRQNQGEPLRFDQVCDIVNVCNACIQVRISAQQGNADDVYESLKDPALSLEDTLQENYKDEYHRRLMSICYDTQTRHGLLFTMRELAKIIREINGLSPDDIALSKLVKALQWNDIHDFKTNLEKLNVAGYNPELIELYMKEMKKSPPENKEQIVIAISKVDEEIKKIIDRGNFALKLNNAILNEGENKTKEILEKSELKNEGIVKPGVMNWYFPFLKNDLNDKRTKLQIPEKENEAFQVLEPCESIPEQKVVVEKSDGKIVVHAKEPEKAQQWPFSSEEIKKILQKVNDSFDEHYKNAEDKIRNGQIAIREYLKRKFEIAEARRRDRAARKIQNSYRNMKSRNHLGELRKSSTPSVKCLRQFIELLRDSELDYEEEISIEKTRSQITHLIKANQKLDEDLNKLDYQIGLLVKNRISLQEVQAHSKKIDEDRDAFEKRQPSIRKVQNKLPLKAFEHLFYHLQVDPVYLANLFEIETVDSEELFLSAVWPLFHFASQMREEFLLMQLYAEILSRYIHSLNHSENFLDGSKKSRRLVKSFTVMLHALPSQTAVAVSLKQELTGFQREENTEGRFNLRPVEMFKEIHNREPKNLEEALHDSNISNVLEHSKRFISKWAIIFVKKIVQNLQLPQNIRYLLKACAHDLRTKFRHLKETEIHQLVAQFLFSTFIELSLTDPKIVKRETGESLSSRQRDILKGITQMINYGIAGQGFGMDVPYMDSLNPELMQINTIFISFTALLNDENSEINESSVVFDVVQPQLHIETKSIKQIHNYLRQYKSIIFRDETSKLHHLVDEAKLPEDTPETFVLHLKPLPNDHVGEGNELFVSTKKLLVELLLCQVIGNTVPEILDAKVTEKEENLHKELEAKKELQFSSIKEKQQKIKENLAKLESLGHVSFSDGYQAIVTQIANDIYRRNKYRDQRAEQLRSLRKTLTDLELRRKQYEDRLETYQTCLNNALDNISIKERRPSIQIQKGGKAEKQLSKRTGKEKVISIKLSGDKLLKKGIAVSQDKENNKLLSKTTLEIKNDLDQKGTFHIDIKQSKHEVEATQIHFQDLLSAQDAGQTEFALNKIVKVHPDTFIEYLNKKFHQK